MASREEKKLKQSVFQKRTWDEEAYFYTERSWTNTPSSEREEKTKGRGKGK